MAHDELPDDATGAALRRVFADGSDPDREMTIDFHVAVPTPEAADRVATEARELGFTVEPWDDDGEWTVQCSRVMFATHEAVTKLEHQLDALARRHGGQADGWGTFGNADE